MSFQCPTNRDYDELSSLFSYLCCLSHGLRRHKFIKTFPWIRPPIEATRQYHTFDAVLFLVSLYFIVEEARGPGPPPSRVSW
jgi:hypothetical protein